MSANNPTTLFFQSFTKAPSRLTMMIAFQLLEARNHTLEGKGSLFGCLFKSSPHVAAGCDCAVQRQRQLESSESESRSQCGRKCLVEARGVYNSSCQLILLSQGRPPEHSKNWPSLGTAAWKQGAVFYLEQLALCAHPIETLAPTPELKSSHES